MFIFMLFLKHHCNVSMSNFNRCNKTILKTYFIITGCAYIKVQGIKYLQGKI